MTGPIDMLLNPRGSAYSGAGKLLPACVLAQGILERSGRQMNDERLKRELNANRLLVVHFDLES